jgi:hypothetical protein
MASEYSVIGGSALYQRALELAVEVYCPDTDDTNDILPMAKQFADFMKDGSVPKDPKELD